MSKMVIFNCILLLLSLLSFSRAQYDYKDVLSKSLLFYEAQRSGKLPEQNRIPWRGDSFLNDRGENGESLTEGYFDAGDMVKFGFPLAGAITMMAYGMVEYQDGFDQAGEIFNAIASLKWGTDYLIKAHVSPNEFYVQVGDPRIDHNYWGRPEEQNLPRPTLKCTTSRPGSEVVGESAAALAAASIVFKNVGSDPYAAECLRHAEELYNFANTYRGKYSDSFPEVQDYYNSWSGFGDELAYSAAWLYRATGNDFYLQEVNRHWNEFGLSSRPSEASWDNKQAAMQILMAKQSSDQKFHTAARNFCNWVQNQAPKTPKGLIFISQWGSLRHISNAAFVCLTYSTDYLNMAKTQMDYILGNGGRSFVVGFGNNPPQRPHHAAASCRPLPAPCDWSDFSKSEPNGHVLTGALVGGPGQNDDYEDDRGDYVKNEVTLDYNAGFQSCIAGLVYHQSKNLI